MIDSGYLPSSKLVERILCDCFCPHVQLLDDAVTVADRYEVTVAEVEDCFKEFVAAGLVERASHWAPAGPRPALYRPTTFGLRTREQLLRARGLRHPALTNQVAYDPKDLIVAILMHWHVFNDRASRGVGMATVTEWGIVELYLDGFTAPELLAARGALVEQRLVTSDALPAGDRVDLSRLGLKRYRSQIGPRLHLAPDESILDHVLDKTIRLFFSWQSEHSASRRQIGAVLESVAKAINAQNPVRPLEVIQSTSVGDGAVRIDVQLMRLIDKADLFVADVTAVAADNGRRRVNDNVLIEVGYALASKAANEVVLVCVKRDDLPKGSVAFDISNVQRIELDPRDKKGGRIQAEIETMLKRKGWLPS